MSDSLIVCLCMLGIGVIFGGFSILFKVISDRSKAGCDCKTYGTVIRMLRARHYYGHNTTATPMLTPEIKYMANGYEIVSHNNLYSTNSKYNVGDTIPILYDRNNPQRFVIEGQNLFKVFIITFGIIGGICILAGIILGIISFL
ncbi:MAG: DUF3592 domain-containing protein [Eubacterium sp.]|nr:DUF3592 domain-containing protein [Eubacterium sp.]